MKQLMFLCMLDSMNNWDNWDMIQRETRDKFLEVLKEFHEKARNIGAI